MRSTRGLLLLAIAGILGGVGASYYHQRRTQARQAPLPPAPLPKQVAAAARDWQWSRSTAGRPSVEVRARSFRQLHDPERVELEQVELRLYHDDGRRFDQVRCAHATFDPSQAALSSEGEVEITMGLRAEGPQGRLILIRASGVSFDSRTGRVVTERLAEFTFDQGEGRAVGASYDPATRELHMRSQAELCWRGRAAGRPMKLEAGELVYKEADSLVMLSPWARLTRDNGRLESQGAVVSLREGLIREVQAGRARGEERRPKQLLEYSAAQLWMAFAPVGEPEKITAEGEARLIQTTESARVAAAAGRLDLEFDAVSGGSILKRVLATGGARLDSEPIARAGAAEPESRRLTSEVIQLQMRPGGREIERVQTEAPGRLEFLANRPGQRRRWLEAERLWIHYADSNRIQSLRAVNVATHTDPESGVAGRRGAAPVQTWSRDLLAEFDPRTGQLTRIEQWNDFRYREGARQARAERAVLDEVSHRITLEKTARLWDDSGSVSAERIELDQGSGDTVALGRVAASRLPERGGRSSALLSYEDTLEAQADRMTTSEQNQKVVYEGRVAMWQRANRLEARQVEIDRRARRLTASGDVMTQFADQPAGNSGKPDARPPVFVSVRAARLVYTEQDRLAHYTGGAMLRREKLQIQAAEIRAWLKEAGQDSSLDRALATGAVRILHQQPGRTRQASAEQAEYYAADERVVLSGGSPSLVDSRRGAVRGVRLIWRARDDNFEVEGPESRPALSRVRRP